MTKKIQLLSSGIPLVDSAWGGLYRGGTYFLIGPRKSGRSLLALQFALECAQQKEVCLFFTSMRPKDLMIHAVSIDFDLQHYMNQNLIIVVKVSPPANLEEIEDPDNYLADYIMDILPVIKQYKPNKIVFDELTPFINFKNKKLLKDTFLQTLEEIEDADITTLLLLGEPANPVSLSIVDLLTASSTGKIELTKREDVVNKYHIGIMTITPNVGHTEGKFSSNYYIEPYKGITVDYNPSDQEEMLHQFISAPQQKENRTLSDLEASGSITDLSKVYSLHDFKLIINNQIALYQITGQLFSLVVIRLRPEAEKRGLLSFDQLENTIRLATNKKDKICKIADRIFVLITRETKSVATSLIAKIKSNLPANDPKYMQAISKLISVSALQVDMEIENAESMIALLLKNQAI
jgi:KaiC/GvpD/RAD55 family RecA-like ATPase